MSLAPGWLRHGWSSEREYHLTLTPDYFRSVAEDEVKEIDDLGAWTSQHTVIVKFSVVPSLIDSLVQQLKLSGFDLNFSYINLPYDNWIIDFERHKCWTRTELLELINFMQGFTKADSIELDGWYILPFGKDD